MKHQCFFICLLFLFYCHVAYGQSFPIIAYGGVPHYRTSVENFRIMRECGFDISIANYDSLDEMKNALTCAAKNNIKIIGDCPETHKSPAATARVLKSYPALYGYFIEDEPSADRMKELKPQILQLQSADKNHICYLNLLPWYDKGQLRSFKTTSYDEYVRTLIDIGAKVISFDIYPIQTSGIRPSWYENLEIIHRESMKAGIPFWGFVLSTPHFDYPQPTIGQLRLQVYSNLAYGAQGIEYFTYWTSPKHGKFDYHDGPVDSKGNKTKTYPLVKEMNAELHQVGKLFLGAEVMKVNHLGTIPQGTTRMDILPQNIKKLKIKGRTGAIISQFRKNSSYYMAVVNKSFLKSISCEITANNIPVRITKNLTQEPLNKKYKIAPGDILIIKTQ